VSGPDPLLPTFLIIGSMKSGTTTLYDLLAEHPDVFLPTMKEPSFFVHNEHRGLDWYRDLFRPGAGARARGEASTDYTKDPRFPGVAGKVAAVLPDARLVYLVRHPIDRMRSQYVSAVREGYEHRPVDQALVEHESYLAFSRYAHQLGRYRDHYDRERFLVLTTDQLERDPVGTVRQVAGFLDLDAAWEPTAPERRSNSSADSATSRPLARRLRRMPLHSTLGRVVPGRVRSLYRRAATTKYEAVDDRPSDETLRWLADQLAPEMEALRDYVGDAVDDWDLA
jgi:Sulfotransferase domain